MQTPIMPEPEPTGRAEAGEPDFITRHFCIDGRVQGVGFRWSMCYKAEKLKLTGWVRNRQDGSVEALAHGPRAEVDALTVWAHRGPPGAHVTLVRFDDRPTTPDERGWSEFIQRPTF